MLANYWVAQFSPVALMVGIIVINHLITTQRADKKTEREASRLRCALAAELRAILDLYNINLQLIDKRANYILSSRSSVVLYRANLARLATLLEATVVEQLVGVFAQNEQIEAILSAHTNLKGGLSYQFSVENANFDEWRTMLVQSSRNIEKVCGLLGDHKRATVSASTFGSWPNVLDKVARYYALARSKFGCGIRPSRKPTISKCS
jgi:hypothetical protein